MKVLIPITFVDSMLFSSTATESVSAWTAGTYSKGALVLHSYVNPLTGLSETRIWESLINTNTEEPGVGLNWLNLRPSNRSAMFDTQISTTTTHSSPLTVVLRPGKRFNSLALFGVVGSTVTISLKNSPTGSVVYTRTIDMKNQSDIASWYSYFFDQRTFNTSIYISDLIPYVAAEITVTITGVGNVACGALLFGDSLYIGSTEYGLQLGISDYSKVNTDDFGITTFVKRANAKTLSASIFLENSQFTKVYNTLSKIISVPTVWQATESLNLSETTTVFGYFTDIRKVIDYPTYSRCSLEIKGLT